MAAMKIIGFFVATAMSAWPAHATTPAAAADSQLRSISYQTGPCLGSCPVYRVTVNADGSGLFEGRRFTAVAGARRFRLTRAQFRAFAAWLAPDRPARGERHYVDDSCHEMATDQSSVEIIWRGAAEQKLDVYYGCDMETNRVMFDRLVHAPSLLPIRDFIRPAR
jgi:hypothetical protein